MKVRGVIGKRIVRVIQQKYTSRTGKPEYDVIAIILEDGTRLDLSVVELEDQYAVEVTARPPRR